MKSQTNLLKSLRLPLFLIAGGAIFLFWLVAFSSCGNSSQTKEEAEKLVDDSAFNATQPVHSGLYDADYYDITGPKTRKGQFDGRIFFSLSPEMSVIQVFENGNRTKIDCRIILKQPFEKGDSGIYRSIDSKENPVTVTTDSAFYVLNFKHSDDDYQINFNPKARYEGTAMEIAEKITSQKK